MGVAFSQDKNMPLQPSIHPPARSRPVRVPSPLNAFNSLLGSALPRIYRLRSGENSSLAGGAGASRTFLRNVGQPAETGSLREWASAATPAGRSFVGTRQQWSASWHSLMDFELDLSGTLNIFSLADFPDSRHIRRGMREATMRILLSMSFIAVGSLSLSSWDRFRSWPQKHVSSTSFNVGSRSSGGRSIEPEKEREGLPTMPIVGSDRRQTESRQAGSHCIRRLLWSTIDAPRSPPPRGR